MAFAPALELNVEAAGLDELAERMPSALVSTVYAPGPGTCSFGSSNRFVWVCSTDVPYIIHYKEKLIIG